jgi:hypothetical protein
MRLSADPKSPHYFWDRLLDVGCTDPSKLLITIDGEEVNYSCDADDVEQWAVVYACDERGKMLMSHDAKNDRHPVPVRIRADVRFWWPGQSPDYRRHIEDGWLARADARADCQPASPSQRVVHEPGRASMADQVEFLHLDALARRGSRSAVNALGWDGEDGG